MGDLQSVGMLSVNVLFSNSIQVCTPCYAVTAISGSGPLLCPLAVQKTQFHVLAQLLLQALGSSRLQPASLSWSPSMRL